MKPADKKVKLSPEKLARMRLEAETARARTEAAWARSRAASAAAPPVLATRDEPERPLRALAHGLAAFAAFLPAALLAGPQGELVSAEQALKHVAAVFLLTLVPAFASARAESAPEAEDTSEGRFARRFTPLAVGLLLAASLPMVFFAWPIIEGALVLQALVGLYAYVPRARACHTFCVLWGALATTTVDERAAPGLLAAFVLLLLAAVLDRSLDARAAHVLNPPEPRLGVLAVAAGVVAAAFGALFAGAFALVHGLALHLPEVTTRRLTPVDEAKRPPLVDLLVALATVFVLLGGYHLLFGRSEREGEGAGDEEEEPPPPPVLQPLGREASVVAAAWPHGPRRALVERYLEHLARLARLGAPRAPAQAPLELARSLGERRPGVLERARRLARAFHAARYGSDQVSTETLEQAAGDASEIERDLGSSDRPSA